ncbi:hypothetical protein ThvES_00021060, partial [Thiovulum sp. ES]
MIKILNRQLYAIARGKRVLYVGFEDIGGESSWELMSEL